ncbi:MAG: hypothetical protein QW786_01600, partial [Candidatus Hadarchaeum sp.]
IDFAMDIVEMDGKPVAKRGKLGGRKQVWRCRRCLEDVVTLFGERAPRCPVCRGITSPLLQPLIKSGKIVAEESADRIRSYVLSQLKRVSMVG